MPKEIDEEEMDRPLTAGGNKKELTLLPEREWLSGKIDLVKYQIAMFEGKEQYITDQNKVPITDKDGNKVERREFEFTISLKDYELDNGNPRRTWLRVGASLNPMAKLPILLVNLGFPSDRAASPKNIVEYAQNLDVKLQMTNRFSKTKNKSYQIVITDAVKKA